MSDILLLHVTFGTRAEALKVARALIDKKLAACASVQEGLTSVYRWEGKVHEDREVLLIAKITKEKMDAAIAAVKGLHSYELPCIIAYPAVGGFLPFLQWVSDETSSC